MFFERGRGLEQFCRGAGLVHYVFDFFFFGFLPSLFLFLMVFFQIFDVGPKILNDYKTYHKASSNVESWLVGLGGRGGGVASVKTK